MIHEDLRPFSHTDIYLLDQIMRGRIQPGMKVLDLACGRGRNIPILLNMKCKVTGVDLDTEAISYCKGQYANAVFLQADIAKYIPEELFDFVAKLFPPVSCLFALGTRNDGENSIKKGRGIPRPFKSQRCAARSSKFMQLQNCMPMRSRMFTEKHMGCLVLLVSCLTTNHLYEEWNL